MNPSEAKVFSSGIKGLLSSKQRDNVSYSRLGQMDSDSVEFSKVHFQKDHTSFCAKLCFGLLALMLLVATVGSAMFIMNLKHFTVEVQLKKGNVHVYKFDHELTIVGNEITMRNMSIVVTMHVINRTESDCWFGVVLSFLPKDIAHNLLPSKDFAFLTRVTSTEHGDFQDGTQKRFKVFGNRKTNSEVSFYVHNILRQLLPIIKVKLYEFVLSKVSSSSRRTVVEKHGFLPGRVHLKRTMITKSDVVTVINKADPVDFESFFSKNGESPVASWNLTYDETSVVDKKTGMVKRSDMSLSGFLPLGSDLVSWERGSRNQGLAVRFRSIVTLLDESEAQAKQWKTAVKDENEINHPLHLPNTEHSSPSLMYFAPPNSKSNKRPSIELRELIKLSENSTGRSTKLPAMIKIVRHKIPKSVIEKSDSYGDDDDDEDDDDYKSNENISEDSDGGDDDGDDDQSENTDDDSQPFWSLPNFAPFGFGYEIKRKRSIETKKPKVNHKGRTSKHSQPSDLDKVWDELVSSSPLPNRGPPRVIYTSIMGLDYRAEIDYTVHVNNGDDDDDDDRNDDDDVDVGWDITTAFRITIGQYRLTPFRRVHTLGRLRSKLSRRGQRKTSRWTVPAGDFVMCIPLFYIQRLCTVTRLTFEVTVTYSLTRLSLSYPLDLTVHIGQTVTNNATISAHASTWFHEGGFYTKGTVAMATLPVKLSFKEDTTPEWCVKGDLKQKMVRLTSVPLSSWNCSLDYYHKLTKTCVGLPVASNRSLVTFDLHYSSAEGTMFDNWHYPINCVHRKDFAPYTDTV